MPRLDDLLATDEEKPAKKSLDDLLATPDDEAAPSKPFKPPSAEDVAFLREWEASHEKPWYEKFGKGMTDTAVGLGQLAQNVIPDAALNAGRQGLSYVADAVGLDEDAAILAKGTSTEQFNKDIRRMEAGYQAERANAGQEGFDWWRVGGNVANPLSWVGASKANTIFQAVKNGAKFGAFQALMQPVTSEGSFIYSKGLQALTGAVFGGALGAAVKGVTGAISSALQTMRASGATAAQQGAAAKAQTDAILQAAGANPAKMDPNLYGSIQREVAEAIQQGASPDPAVITNRADAAALPVPMNLSRGQASGDPMQFAWEQRVAGQQGVGEPISDLLATQNRNLIENMNALGAGRAVAPIDVSKQLIGTIQAQDDAARDAINQAYRAVRDSAGRPARMDNDAFVAQAKNLLTEGRPELANLVSLADHLPETVGRQFNDIMAGKLPLTVDTAQFLDRTWGAVQRGNIDGAAKSAIGALRTALNDAPVSDALGAESMQAYKVAREMARQRFAAIEQNPAYKAVVDGVEPDRFFQRHVLGANASEVSSLLRMVGPENARTVQNAVVDELKNTALSRASDERGVFSQAALNKKLQDPVFAPRLAAIFESAPQVLDHLYRVGRISELTTRIPAGSKVNTSNTASAVANVVRDAVKEGGATALLRNIPGGDILAGLARVGREARDAQSLSKAVESAVSPGVTASPVVRRTTGDARLSDLLGRAGGAYAGSEAGEGR